MSGGVDSSVAATLLRDAGYECIGAFIRVGAHAAHADEAFEDGGPTISPSNGTGAGTCRVAPAESRSHASTAPRRLKHGCCSASDALDARAVAGKLGIPFYALNFERDFDRIIDYFVDEYAQARTPNPCVMCNIHVKFGRLLAYADLMDAEFVATGHYARVLGQGAGRGAPGAGGDPEAEPRSADGPCLVRSLNPAKDQTYVLAGIRRAALGRCLFPLGEIADKADVRRRAAELGLRVHDKPDSQEICFVPDNDYRTLVQQRRPELFRAGEVVDERGAVVGRHAGVAGFTIGQRRGLGIAAGRPVYVTRLDVLSNRVTIGERDALRSGGLVAADVNWLVDPPAGRQRGAIKIRHQHTAAPGWFEPADDGTLRVGFDQPQDAVTPGQAAVVYRGDTVVCGGWISRAVARLDSGKVGG